MNFASNLIASAEKAASAVNNFKGFDEMAEEDEYIHSDGLNVVKQYTDGPQQQKQQQQPPKHSNVHHPDSLPSAEPTWSLLDRPTMTSTISSVSPASSTSPPRQRPPAAPASFKKKGPQPDYFKPSQRPQPQPMPYLSVVADAMESSNHPSSGYDTDNEESTNRPESSSSSSSSDESDNDSDDDEYDPILSQIRQSKQSSSKSKSKSKTKKQRRKQEKHAKSSRKSRREHTHSHHQQPSNKKSQTKKNPHRFMDELDQREAAGPLSSTNQHVLEMERNALASSADNGNNPNPLSSLKNWMSTSLQRNNAKANTMAAKASSFLKLGPLSRRDPQAATNSNNSNTIGDEENFHVVSSSNVLGDDELAALARLNSSSQPSLCSVRGLCRKARENPREAFIVFTMLFALYAWFFPRK